MTPRHVAVIGGGLAGISAALDLRAAGSQVTLLESRGRLGGAAFSFTRDGLLLDNGQHVFLRCCTAYLELLERIGAAQLVTLQPRLRIPVRAPGGRRAVLERAGLPAPLHLAPSLLRFSLLSPRERLSAALAMRRLGALDPDDPAVDARSLGAWLREQRQSERAIATLWELIARPTLNLTAEAASLAQAAQVFQVGLLGDPAAADVGYATVPLSEIHDVAARDALERAGVAVRLRSGVRALRPDAAGGFDLELSGGAPLHVDAVVLATTHERARRLLPTQAEVPDEQLAALGTSPIVNLHVMLERRVLEEPFLAAVDSPLQWIFDRTDTSGTERGQHLAVSLSAAEEEFPLSAQELRTRYQPALRELFGDELEIRSFFVTREHAATFRAAPGQRALRPGPRTALPGLVLAGAWTDTGWPATMEGAVRSGHAAASALLDAPSPTAHATPPRAAHATPPLTVLAPLGLEARALRAGAPDLELRRTGVGPRRAARAALSAPTPGPVLLAGFCGALNDRLQPGDIVLADRLQTPGGTWHLPDPALLATTLRRGGLNVHVGLLACTRAPVSGAARRRALAQEGALAVDMESAAVARALPAGQSLSVLRVVLDTPHHELHRPLRVLQATRRAYAALRHAASLLEEWRCALGDREVVLASPRASCAGVERAIEVVERALETRTPPVYVRKQIVHNAHVIAELERRGAVFVDELDEVPEGATVIFSAHGVSPAVRAEAAARDLDVIDATCPLVAKVHAEARRFSGRGFQIVLVGHEGHEEVEGTFGEAPEQTHIVGSVKEAEQLELPAGRPVAYLTQTTLAHDETAGIIDTLRTRYPELDGPPSSDICYATQNRQDAVRALAEECELVLVVGSPNSSNSRRLVEVAERAGAPAILIEDAGEIPPALLHGRRRIGVTAGASAPDTLVQGVVTALSALGETMVRERRVVSEQVIFKLPAQVRGPIKEKTWQSQ